MEKQHSVKFFESFVRDIHKECQNFVCFDQMVEVSGYMCLEIDNVKKERYLLSELIQSSGSVISESFCTKVFRNCPTQRPSAQRGNGKRNMTAQNPALNQNRHGQGGVIRQQNMLQQNTRTPLSRSGQSQQMQRTSQPTKTGQNVPSHVQMTQRVKGSHMNQHRQASPVTGKGAVTTQVRQRHNSVSIPLTNRENNSQMAIVKNPNKLSFSQRLDQAANSQLDGSQKTKDISQSVNQQCQGQYTNRQGQCANQQGQGQFRGHQGQCANQQGQCPTQLNPCQSVNQQGQGQYSNHQGQCANQQGQGQYRSHQGQCVNQLDSFQVKEGMNQTSVQDPNLGKLYGQNAFHQAAPQGNVQDKSRAAGAARANIKQEEDQTHKEVCQTTSLDCIQQNILDMKPTVHTSAFTDQDRIGEVKGINIDQAPETPCDSFQQKGSKINVQEIPQAAETSNVSSKVASRRTSINIGHVGQDPSSAVVPNQQTRRFSAPVPDQVFLQQRDMILMDKPSAVDGHTKPVQTQEKTTHPSEWQIIEVEPDVSVVSVTPGVSAVTLSAKPVSAPGRKDHPFQKDRAAVSQNNPPQLISQGPVARTQVMNVSASYSPGQTQNISQTKSGNPTQMLKTEVPPTLLPVQSMNFPESCQKRQPFVSVVQCLSNSQSLPQEAQPAVSHLSNTKIQSDYEKPFPQSSHHSPELPASTIQHSMRVSALKPLKYGLSSKNLPQSSNQDHRLPVLTQEMKPPILCLTESSNVNPIAPMPVNSNPNPPILHKITDRRPVYNSSVLSPQAQGDVFGPSSSDLFEITAMRPSVLQESSILTSSLTSSAHNEADKQQIKMKSSMSQLLVASSTKPSTSDGKTSTSRQMESNPKASAVPAKKAKLSLEPTLEDTSVLMSKQAKPVGKKGRETSAKKQVKKGRRKSTKPKKVDVNDLTSDEENCEVSADPVPRRNLRSAQRTERQVYREEDPDLSDSSVPGDK
ncbi:uncharacterized protein [Haliotis asinina]|uniref:uncharacterized protein n=1 Tax=Haliotis asinina TaxID=109174 RepID=UPI003531879F